MFLLCSSDFGRSLEESRDDLQSFGYDTPAFTIRSDSYTTLLDATAPAAAWRGDAVDARQQLTELIAGSVERPLTAHDVAARATTSALPANVQHVMQRRRTAVLRRQGELRAWRQAIRIATDERAADRARDASGSRSVDQGLEL